jgi:indole-3-glycerol phosphate synthase
MNTLEQICEKKREHIRQKKTCFSLDDLKYKVADTPLPSGFLCRLMMNDGPALIAEVKKASPSKGLIREDFDPVAIANAYQNANATCISVLTDEPYFQGHDDDLCAVEEAVDIPVLRKDFMLDPYQIYESRMLGADCILLIMAALDDSQALTLYETALELQLDILVEVHNLAELERALRLNPMMVGVNNRNLKTLEVNINTSLELLTHIPQEIYKISESGIGNHNTLENLNNAGYGAFLVGESLLRQENIEQAVHDLLGIS